MQKIRSFQTFLPHSFFRYLTYSSALLATKLRSAFTLMSAYGYRQGVR